MGELTFLRELGDELERRALADEQRTGAPTPRRRRRRAAAVAAIALVAGISGLVAVGGSPNDVVERAYAATDPSGAVLHLVEDRVVTQGAEERERHRVERWWDGTRLRTIERDPQGRLRTETVVGEGVIRVYSADMNEVTREPLRSEGGAQYLDLVQLLRDHAARGELRRAGDETEIDGIRVIELVAEEPETMKSWFVRADNFEPVEFRLTLPEDPGVRQVTRLRTYERLPRTPATLERLKMAAHPGATSGTGLPRPPSG